MFLIRKIYSWLFGLILAVALFLVPVSFITRNDLNNVNKISGWSSSAGDYQTLINDLTTQISNNAQLINFKFNLNLTNQQIKNILEQSLSPGYFNQIKNQVFQANYSWLSGKTAQPTFLISLINLKDNLINQITSLPVLANYCHQLALYRITTYSECQNQVVSSVTASPIFANYETLSQDNLTTFFGGSPKSKPYYITNNQLPNYFQKVSNMPNYLIIVISTIILLSLLVFGFRFRYIKFLFRSLTIAIIGIIAMKFLINPIFNSLSKVSAISNNPNSSYIVKLISYYSKDLKSNLNYFIYIYLVIFAVIVVVYFSRFFRKKSKNKLKQDKPQISQPSQNFISLNERKSQHK